MQMRKTTLVFLFAIIIISMLSACGKSSSNAKSTSPTKETSNEASKGSTSKEPTTVEEIALYEGPDRDQRLVEAAKKEGTLSVYTATPQEDIKKIAEAFKEKYGINVEVWRSNAVGVLQKIVTEARGGKYQFDVVANPGLYIEALSREKLLLRVNSPHISKVSDQSSIPAHREWVPFVNNIFVQAYNTKNVRKEDLPKKWEDLVDPKWKGRLGIEPTNVDWFYTVVQQMGEEKGLKFFKDLAKTTQASPRVGNSLLAEMVAKGELDYALTVFSYKTRQLKAQGAPLDWYAIEPAVARPTGVAVSKKAPHPNAAVLFFDFMLSDAQKIMADIYYDPVHQDFQPPERMKLVTIKDQKIMDENEKWSKLYDDIVVKRLK